VNEYVIVVNGRKAVIPQKTLTVEELRALFDVPDDWALVRESRGGNEDRLLDERDVVSLDAGPVHVFSRPPTTFG
jgi:hypothetical protein